MKRGGPLKRTELKRGTKPMKRSRLNPVSKRTAKLKRETNPARHAYVSEIGKCVCGKPAVDCHEIAAGTGNRPEALKNRFAWLALCRACHERLQGSDMDFQYALKCLQDRNYYDREGLNFLRRGKENDSVSESDALFAAYQLGLQHGGQR